MLAHVNGGKLTHVEGDRSHPLSRGYSCPKGRAIAVHHHADNRTSYPRVAERIVSWEECLDDIAGIIRRQSSESGPDRIASYCGTGLYADSVGWWLQGSLLERMGSRQRYSAATVDVAPLLKSAELVTGFHTLSPSWTPEEAAPALVIFLATNPSVSHGYIGLTPFSNPTHRLREFRRRGGEYWVIDPRATKSSRDAHGHIAPKPGTDAMILGWLVREILKEGYDESELRTTCHPSDVLRLRKAVANFDLSRVAAGAGVAERSLLDLLAAIRRHRKVAILPGTGLSFAPHGVVADWLRWVLLIITGSLDRPGGMHFKRENFAALGDAPWTGHAPEDGAVSSGPRSRPELHGMFGERPAAAIVDEIEAGEIRTLFVAGGNPITAFPNPDRTKAALRRLEALIVADPFENELTSYATHVLPVVWQTERADMPLGGRRHYTDPVLPPGAQRKPMWWIYGQLAKRLSVDIFDGAIDVDHSSERDVVRWFGTATWGGEVGADAVIAAGPHGLDGRIEYGWVHERVLPGGRWRLAPEVLVRRLPAIWKDHDPGILLVSGRVLHNMNSAIYARQPGREGRPHPIHISPDIGAREGFKDGDLIRVTSRSGFLEGEAVVDPTLRSGLVWVNHGWPTQNVGKLVDGQEIDPMTGQPIHSGIGVAVTGAIGVSPEKGKS